MPMRRQERENLEYIVYSCTRYDDIKADLTETERRLEKDLPLTSNKLMQGLTRAEFDHFCQKSSKKSATSSRLVTGDYAQVTRGQLKPWARLRQSQAICTPDEIKEGKTRDSTHSKCAKPKEKVTNKQQGTQNNKVSPTVYKPDGSDTRRAEDGTIIILVFLFWLLFDL
ncbi:hypothetical protein FQA39_LY02029 [Lamprigera yunnana]|nr:hypothetical protein FQA39_LY02029 [Lamprigera yunnana]